MDLLTKDTFKQYGWTLIPEKSIWLSKYRTWFSKGNYICCFDYRKPHIEIAAMDLLKVDFMHDAPENFRVTIPCKYARDFRRICQLLGISSV